MELRYTFSGVDCPNCAAKIEARLNKRRLIQSARIDFSQSTLRVTALPSAVLEDLEKEILSTFQAVEDGSAIRPLRPEDADQTARRVVLPDGDFAAQCETLRSLGGELFFSDANARVAEIAVDSPWHSFFEVCEEKIPGILPFQEKTDDAPAEDDGASRKAKIEKFTFVAGAVAFAVALAADKLFHLPAAAVIALYALAYLPSAYPVLLGTWRGVRARDPFNENFLMTVATVGAFLIGENAEGVLVMLFYRLGETFQQKAVNQSRDSIKRLTSLKPDHANLLFGARAVTVDPKCVRVGDRIEIRPGERVPLDGIVVSGATSLDVSEMTGESAPRDIAPGDEALSGAINGGGLIVLEVTRTSGDSSVSRVLKLVAESSANKARKERVFTRFARIYTPLVCLTALLVMLIPPLFFGGDWYSWIYRGLSFLVVSCPCALVLSIPLSFFGGVGAASKRGVLVKGGECLEALSRADVAVFDKTGTLTEGIMQVVDVRPAPGVSTEKLLTYAATAESRLNHPIAEAVVRAASQTELPGVSEYENVPGEGVRCLIGQTRVAVGNRRLMLRENAEFVPAEGTAAYVALGGKFAGSIRLEDQIRADAPALLSSLKKLGFTKTAMLTGDVAHTAQSVANRLGVDELRAELLPDQKVSALQEIAKTSLNGCIFVGDGVNDAPVLSAATVGVAMGGVGSDAAIEAADVVLLSDEISRLAQAVQISRKTLANVTQNVALALGVKLLVMLLILLGVGEMWMAVVADAGVALVCVLNALRLLR